MVLLYPHKPKFNNQAEELVYNVMKDHLPDHFVGYFNYHIIQTEFDMAVLIPNKGILILEIKGWLASRIIEVTDNNQVVYRRGDQQKVVLNSPFKQAKGYQRALINRLREQLNLNVVVIPMVCFPLLTRQEYLAKRLDIISPPNFTLLKEEIDAPEQLERRLLQVFDLFQYVGGAPFDLEQMNRVRLLFETEEQIEQSLSRINQSLLGEDRKKGGDGSEKEEFTPEIDLSPLAKYRNRIQLHCFSHYLDECYYVCDQVSHLLTSKGLKTEQLGVAFLYDRPTSYQTLSRLLQSIFSHRNISTSWHWRENHLLLTELSHLHWARPPLDILFVLDINVIREGKDQLLLIETIQHYLNEGSRVNLTGNKEEGLIPSLKCWLAYP